MNIPPYDAQDLTADLVLKHFAHLNGDIIQDITTVINTAFGDGYCRGYNAANAWWEPMNEDIEYIKSFDNNVDGSGYLVDTFNDDLVAPVYGDIPSVEDINLYYELVKNPSGNNYLFNRRNKND